MKIGDVWYEKHTVTEISQRTNTVSEAQVERVNAIPIPDNATNGDVIKTLFPSCKTRSENTPTNFMEFSLDGIVGYAIEKSWWNARYKAESDG